MLSVKDKATKHKKNSKGSLTIEAALVLPVVMMVILVISSFVQMVHAQEVIHYHLTEVAGILADTGYIFKANGLVDLQQKEMENSLGREAIYQDLIEDIGVSSSHTTVGYSITIDSPPSFSFKLEGSNLVEYAESWIQNYQYNQIQFTNYLVSLISMGANLTETAGYIFEDATLLTGGDHYSDYIGKASGFMTGLLSKSIMSGYISDGEIRKLGVIGGYGGLDFSESSYMLIDDLIIIKVRYQLKVPFLEGLVDKITIKDQIICKAFVGNGNYKTQYGYHKSKEKEEEKSSETVYITRKGIKYHVDSQCFHIHVVAYPTLYLPHFGKISLCQHCTDTSTELSSATMLYKTDGDSKYHMSATCYHINKEPIPIEKEMAKLMGYTGCLHCSKGD